MRIILNNLINPYCNTVFLSSVVRWLFHLSIIMQQKLTEKNFTGNFYKLDRKIGTVPDL